MSQQDISTTREGPLQHIRLTRPSKRNAVTMSMFRTFASMLRDAETDSSVRAIVLSGEGSDFCAGHDLEAFDSWPQNPGDPVPEFLHVLAALTKPLVIAAHGHAVGIGATLMLHADWSLCTSEAQLRLPFADLDIGPEAGSSLLLGHAIGSLRAKFLLLSGQAFSGKQAFDWGMVAELAPLERLLDRARHMATQLAERAALVAQLKRWQVPESCIRERIDAEVRYINTRIVKRRPSEAGL